MNRTIFTAVLALLGLLGFGLIAMLVSEQKTKAFDTVLIAWIQGMENPYLTRIMLWFTTIGSGIPAAVIAVGAAVFLYVVLGHRRELMLFIAVIAGSGLLNLVLKEIFRRARPDIHRIASAAGFSFPSGHSMAAFSMYGILIFLLWKHIPSVWGRGLMLTGGGLFILAIGISRIYLGVHYPSDVAGAYLVSGSWLALSITLYQWWIERQPAKQAGRK